MTASFVRGDADLVRILEATHRPASSARAWAEEVLAAFGNAFAFTRGVGLNVIEHDEELRRIGIPVWLPPDWMGGTVADNETLLKALSQQAFRSFFFGGPGPVTHVEVERGLKRPDAEMLEGFRRSNGLGDALGLVTRPEPGTLVGLFAGSRETIVLGRTERRVLAEIALHLESGYRVLRRPGAVKGRIDADGKVVWRAADAPIEAALARHAAGVGRALATPRGRAEAVDAWEALVGGELGVVERPGRGRRHYDLVENEPPVRGVRALTKREVAILSMAARGMSVKLIAYGLGISSPGVSRALGSAASKVGVAGPMEVVRLAALLAEAPPGALDAVALTDSEREVLGLLQQGLSNRQIAATRGRSVRTIANQVASLLRKTGSTSRRALVARGAEG